jgi:hypothetical protein
MKLVTLVVMVLLLSTGMRYARPYIMKMAGMPEMPNIPGVEGAAGAEGGMVAANFSSEESDLMSTVFKSAMRFLSGTATRNELSGELSDKLYGGRAGAGEMSELGIELVKPDGSPTAPGGAADLANLPPGATAQPGVNGQPGTNGQPTANGQPNPNAQRIAKVAAKQQAAKQQAAKLAAQAGKTPGQPTPADGRDALLGKYMAKAKTYSIELTLIPVVFLGMFLVQRARRKRSPEDAFMLPDLASITGAADTEPHTMKHAVHSLSAEDFEMLIALIYQRQGYRVSMPSALSGGRGGDFMLLRKSERILVQCKRLSADHKVPVEKVKELHDAVTTAGATRGMFVAPCSFSWDSRNFAKTKGMMLINARTLDELINAARENPDEDLLAVDKWAPKLIGKFQLTPSLCPACEAAMEEIKMSNGSVWVCSQRPDCKGRRCARKYHKPAPASKSQATEPAVEGPANPEPRDVPPAAKTPVPAAAKTAVPPPAKTPVPATARTASPEKPKATVAVAPGSRIAYPPPAKAAVPPATRTAYPPATQAPVPPAAKTAVPAAAKTAVPPVAKAPNSGVRTR